MVLVLESVEKLLMIGDFSEGALVILSLRCEGRFKGLTPRRLMKWQAYAICYWGLVLRPVLVSELTSTGCIY